MSDVPLKDFVERIFTEHEKHYDARFKAQEEARNLTRESIDTRLHEMDGKLDDLRLTRAELSGKAQQSDVNTVRLIAWGALIVGVLSFIVNVVRLFHG